MLQYWHGSGGAGIIERQGRLLICRRRPDQVHPAQMGIPGGKVESGETPQQALARELQEELGISRVGPEVARYQHTYPGRDTIELIFFRVREFGGKPRNAIFHEMRWEPTRSSPNSISWRRYAVHPGFIQMAILSGIHPVVEALRARHSLERLLVAQGAGGPRMQEIIDLARRASVPVRFEPRAALDRLAGTPRTRA